LENWKDQWLVGSVQWIANQRINPNKENV
jgi:hypothetical protein